MLWKAKKKDIISHLFGVISFCMVSEMWSRHMYNMGRFFCSAQIYSRSSFPVSLHFVNINMVVFP